jgi:hypothetical protein
MSSLDRLSAGRQSTFAAFVCLLAAAGISTLGCANRGMKADAGPRDTGGSADMHVTTGGSGGGDGGSGGGDGGSGGGGGAPTDTGGPDLTADAAPDTGATDGPRDTAVADGPRDTTATDTRDAAATDTRDGGACTARFSFEGGMLYGATNNTSFYKGFTAIANKSTKTFCGNGALEITSAFSGTTGATTGGEVIIPLAAGGEDLTGKTISVNVSAGQAGAVAFYLGIGTSAGVITVISFPAIDTTWMSMSTTLGASTMGVTSVSQLILHAFSYTGYTGTIYVDEIDIR